VNECTAKLALSLESVIVGTARLRSRVSPKVFHVWDFPTVSTVQQHWCSGAQGLWLPMYKSISIIMCLFYGIKIMVQHLGCRSYLSHTQMVYGARHLM
jgi:hypothetical protein